MTHSLKPLKDSEIELHVELDAKDLATAVEKAKARVSQDVHLDGFRKGKTPKDLLQKVLGERIKEEALQIAVSESLSDVVEKENLHVIDQKDFAIEKNDPDRLVFRITLSTFPAIVLGQYKGLKIKRNKLSVSDEEINHVLADIAKLRVVPSAVERPAKDGDKVEIDFLIKENGELIDGGKGESYPVVIGESRFIKGFEEQIVGMEKGQTKQFSLTVPTDFYQTSIAGKHIDCEVVLRKVEEQNLPALDDNFAKTLGSFDSIEALKANISQGLLIEKEHKEKDRIHQEILKTIADASTFETPAYLIDRRLEGMLHDFDEELHGKGMELGLYLAKIKKTQDELKQDWRPRAELLVRIDLVMRTLAQEEKIVVTDEEVERQAQDMIEHYIAKESQDSVARTLQNIDIQALRDRVRTTLLNNKIFEFLESQTDFS